MNSKFRLASLVLAILFILSAAMPAAAQDTTPAEPVKLLNRYVVYDGAAAVKAIDFAQDGEHPDQANDARTFAAAFGGLVLADPGERLAICALPDPDGTLPWVKLQRGEAITCLEGGDSQGKMQSSIEVELPARGHTTISTGGGNYRWDKGSISLPHIPQNTYQVYWRNGTDTGKTIWVTGHNGPHGLWSTFNFGGAFVSAEYAQQQVDNAFVRRNCVFTGCDTVTVIEIETESGAVSITLHQAGTEPVLVYSNWS